MRKSEVDRFLAEKRVAVVGVSRKSGKFSNLVYRKLKESGYETYPVHPEVDEIEGDRCTAGISGLPAEVRAMMIVASPDVSAKVLGEVCGSGIERVWVFSGKRNRPDVEAEIERLTESGISVISGFCPFMFLEPVGSFHSVHRFLARLFGGYPR